jgi:hypothetical protein
MPECRITLQGPWLCDVDFGHGFWTPGSGAEERLLGLLQRRSFLNTSLLAAAGWKDESWAHLFVSPPRFTTSESVWLIERPSMGLLRGGRSRLGGV